MSDLVTRLRQRLGDAWALNDEAADEIERLYALRDHWTALVEEQEAKIEELRAWLYGG